ncbi:hypothetical protein BH11BAC3_BH11BAC3_31810 [soil metagenome]
MSKRLYTAFSFLDFIWSLLQRLSCVFALIYSVAHFDENPFLFIIASGLCIYFIFTIGADQIIVYQDRITKSNKSFSALIFRPKDSTYYINQIKAAYLQTIPKSETGEIVAAVLLTSIFSKRKVIKDNLKPIFFDLKSGETVNFETSLENHKMKRIVDVVNSLLK